MKTFIMNLLNGWSRRLALSVVLVLTNLMGVHAQWSDATFLLKNPTFDTNIEGWEVTVWPYSNGGFQGANYEGEDGAYLSNFIEVWRQNWMSLGDGTIQQVVTLPAGRYILTADAIAQWQGSTDTEAEGAYLFASTSAGEEMEPMWATSPKTFSVEFEVPVMEEVTLGVYIESTNCNWVAADNFRLQYYGSVPDIPVESFGCDVSSLRMLPGGIRQLTVYYAPDNATNATVTWSSSNSRVATVDDEGLVTAVAAGSCTLTATCGGKRVTVSVRVDSATGKGWVDVTDAYIENADVSVSYSGWECERSGGTYNYTYGAAELWNNTFLFHQTLSDLPAGHYRFGCSGYTTYEGSQAACIFAGDAKMPLRQKDNYDILERPERGNYTVFDILEDEKGNIQYYYTPTNFEAAAWYVSQGYYDGNHVDFYHEGGDLEVGLRGDMLASERWVVFDNFQLQSFQQIVATTALSIIGDNSNMVIGETRQMSVAITPSNATYQTVVWTTTDPSVITVDKDGMVSAVGNGRAAVKVTALDNSNVTATVWLTVADSQSTGADLVINEVMTMNIDQFVDPSWNYGGWIELYNPTGSAVSLVDCHVTDNRANLCQHQLRNAGVVPAHGYYVLWFDHFSEDVFPTQVGFSLDAEGGWVALVSPQGELLTEQSYPAGKARTSWARTANGGSTWGITAQPTPGASNATSKFATQQLAAPVVDVEGHLYTTAPVVHVTWPQGSTLRYTTDGSAPTATNGKTSTTGVFRIEDFGFNNDNVHTTLRLCAVQDGYLPSPVVTNSYIRKEHDFSVPVLAISGTDDNFFSDEMGNLVEGTNGAWGGPNVKWNVYQDWDRPAVFEYFEPQTGERLFCQEVGISAAGGWSRTYDCHTSFKIKASKHYGINSLDYPFFDEKPYNKHKALQIRNGGNDRSRFKDAAIQQIVGRSGLYIDYQEYQPVFHYINGRYACLFNMREPNNKHHAYSNYGLDTDLMDQFELTSHPVGGNYYEQMVGTKDTLLLWMELAEQCEDPAVYKRICDELVDIDEFINYMAVEIWLGCGDWLTNSNNVKGFRSTEGDGRFHFVLFDTDSAFEGSTSMASSIDGSIKNDITILWSRMMRNAEFRKKFLDTFSIVCGSVFEPGRCQQIIDQLYAVAEPMMNLSGESASSAYNNLTYNLVSSSRNNQVLKNNTQGYSRLAGETGQPIDISFSANVEQAQLLYNGMNVPTNRFAGRAFLPVTVTAGAVPGYDFVGWQQLSGQLQNVTSVFGYSSAWSYYDKGSLDGIDWKSTSYSASGWTNGNGPLGYDTKYGSLYNELNSVLDYGGDSNAKYPTYYFRKTFSLSQKPSNNDVYTLQYRMDDGCIIYVNGTEVKRDNMPSGSVSFYDYSITYDNKTVSVTIPNNLLKAGNNVIAVEVHNCDNKSTDILWDAQLQAATFGASGGYVSTDAQLQLTEELADAQLQAVYRASATASVPVKVNELSAANDIHVNDYYKKDDWIELYNTTDEPVDVAGMYLSDDASMPQKFQIPDNDVQQTVIEPHGHLVVWASSRSNKGEQVHANFKLGNADGERVILTSEDGTWADQLIYPAHSSKETVGLFPNGGSSVYRMTHPSICRDNELTYYTQYLYENSAYTPEQSPVFALRVSEGWNWVSHPMGRNVATTELQDNTLRIVGQQAETTNANSLGWVGSLTALAPGVGYKMQMAQDAVYQLSGDLNDQAHGTTLRIGWNWIGYPLTDSQNLQAALSGFYASDGDRIIGRQGIATYEGGTWDGSLEVLQPGQGYLYKSALPKTLKFAQTANAAKAARARFHQQPRTPWTAADAPYPDVMGVVAKVVLGGDLQDEEAFSVGAFAADGECRGIGRHIDGKLYINVFGNPDERITFRAADSRTGVVYDITEQLQFTSDVVGSRMAPMALHIGNATDISSARPGSDVLSVAFYNLSGTLVANDQSQLAKGIYVMKCTLANGSVIAKTIVKK